MKLEFANYERSETTLESMGTVLDNVGKDGSIALIPKNLKDVTKRVVIILKNKAGKSVQITCSKQVSDGLRNKSIELGHVLNFEVLYGESEVPYISLPGGNLIEHTVKSLTAKEWEASTVSHEDLIAL